MRMKASIWNWRNCPRLQRSRPHLGCCSRPASPNKNTKLPTLISNHPNPLEGASIDRCPDMSRSHVGAGLVASIVQRTFHEPSTLNQRNHRLTQPTTHIYGQHLPHKSQTQWVPEKVKLFIVGSFNNALRIASLKGSIFLNKWECASFGLFIIRYLHWNRFFIIHQYEFSVENEVDGGE